MHIMVNINKYLKKGEHIMSKINVALIFGGKSGEHEVSLLSTASICKHINRDKYNVFTIGITKEGRWMFYDGNEENIKDVIHCHTRLRFSLIDSDKVNKDNLSK